MNIENIGEKIKALKKENRTVTVSFRITESECKDIKHYAELFGFKTISSFLSAVTENFINAQKEWEQKSQKGEK